MDMNRTKCSLNDAIDPEVAMHAPLAHLLTCCADKNVDALNAGCFCVSLDKEAIRQSLASELGDEDLVTLTEERCPYVFAARPVFIARDHIERMRQLIAAVEHVVALPAYREQVLSHAPAIARHAPQGAKSVFFGYDFHVHEQGISLIEINTNAGGAMLNAIVAKAQRACCSVVEKALPSLDATGFEQSIVAMFREEWRLGGHARPLKTIAIVDDNPAQQYLYPEFLLFQRLFKQHGIEAVIAAPSELLFDGGVLKHGDVAIDLVYNRLTDFMLEESASAALRTAYLSDAIVLTPHPQAHALYANKRNLTILTDKQKLDELAVPSSIQETLLSSIPHTEMVNADNADRLWSERRKLFFKPVSGFGGRAAYRGDKITKRVWEEVVKGDYVAQMIVSPTERATGATSDSPRLKFDIRAYAYDGKVQWVAARLYQGQTTNFRTPGGGFAPVYQL